MGIRITTDEHGVRVWRSDRYGYAQYNVSIQKKKDDGGYITMYKQVKFVSIHGMTSRPES